LLGIFLQLTPVAFTVLPFAMLILLLADLKMSRSTPQGIVFGITLAALAAHAILHWQSNTLLPKDRTALWILFFLQVLAILIAARPTAAIAQTIVGVWLLCQLACLRLDHFKEWKFDANSDRLFDAFECVEPQLQQPPSIYTDWTVVSALNYYRYERQRWNFPVLAVEYELKTPPSGRDVYFLEIENQQEFIQREGLTVVYHDKVSGRGLAIRVPLKDLQKSTCPASLTDSVKSWRKTLANNGTPERTSTP
jgi:hypothetical protein